MMNYLANLLVIILILKCGGIQAINPNDPSYFPPFTCNSQPKLKGAATNVTLWPNGIVYYDIGPEFNSENRAIIMSGLQMILDSTSINGKSCISFKQRTNEPNYVYVSDGGGCGSYVGMIGGKQYLSLLIGSPTTATCLTPDIVAHEFIHALGFDHEQSRPDRDNYVEYYPENLFDPDYSSQFDKAADYLNLNTPYDVLSIMHYQSDAFAKSGTYTLLSKVPPKIILRNLLITDIDALEMQLLYKCTTQPATTSIKPVTTSQKPATTSIKPVTTSPNPTTTSIKTTRPITTPTQKPFPIQWNDGLGYSWATNCDFPSNDLIRVSVSSDLCSFKCWTTLGCTHYSWSNGVCYLKKNMAVTKSNAVANNNRNTFCGIISQGETNVGTTLTANQNLYTNFYLTSQNSLYKAILLPNGDFNLMKENRLVFSISVTNKANLPFYLSLQADGNLMLYNSLTNPVEMLNRWGYSTYTNKPRLVLQNDGNLALLNSNNFVYWISVSNEIEVSRCLNTGCKNSVSTLPCNNQNKVWIRVKYLDGYSTYMNKATGLYLTDSGSAILTRAKDGSRNQDWIISDSQLVNRATNKIICYA